MNNSKPTPKGQHTTPCVHLKHFIGAQPPGHVWTYDAESGLVRSSPPENTGYIRHFYSVTKADGTKDAWIEDHLARAESKASPIYERLLAGEIPTNQERMAFANFIALMYVRTPGARRMAGEMVSREIQIRSYFYATNSEAFDSLVRRKEQMEGRNIDEAEREKMRNVLVDPSRFTLEIPKEHTLPALGVADDLTPILFQMKWLVVSASSGYFVTSDNPVVRWINPKTIHPVYGDHGFQNKTAEVRFPLSPKLHLMMSWDDRLEGRATVGRAEVDDQNRFLASQSDRYLYAHIEDKRVARLARRFKNSRPEITTIGFGPKQFANTKVGR